MKVLHIEAAIDTPEIYFDPKTKVFSISGISHPENAKEFYESILDWLDEYYEFIADNGKGKIVFDINLRYINSASYKYLREVLKKVSYFYRNGLDVEVIWNYQKDDEDLMNEGMVLLELPDINLPYRCIAYL
jgi:hypothetical protein